MPSSPGSYCMPFQSNGNWVLYDSIRPHVPHPYWHVVGLCGGGTWLRGETWYPHWTVLFLLHFINIVILHVVCHCMHSLWYLPVVAVVFQLELATSVSPPTRPHVTMSSALSGALLSKFSRSTLMAGGLLGMPMIMINNVHLETSCCWQKVDVYSCIISISLETSSLWLC